MALHSIDILTRPVKAWIDIAREGHSALRLLLGHTLPWALVAALCWYYGVTQVGWRFGDEPMQRLANPSAARICMLFYVAMVARRDRARLPGALDGRDLRGRAIERSRTASRSSRIRRRHSSLPAFSGCTRRCGSTSRLASWSRATAFICSIVGVPIVMHVAPERGFLFASAIVAVALVGVVATMAATALLWDFGAEPVFTY